MKIFDWIKKKKEPEKQTEEGNTSIVESDILDIEIKMPQTENTENSTTETINDSKQQKEQKQSKEKEKFYS